MKHGKLTEKLKDREGENEKNRGRRVAVLSSSATVVTTNMFQMSCCLQTPDLDTKYRSRGLLSLREAKTCFFFYRIQYHEGFMIK